MAPNELAKELGPRKHAVKHLEMTIRRALGLIEMWDNLPKEAKDWTDGQPADYRKALEEDTFDPTQAVLPELWDRYKSRQLHQEVLDLAANIDLDKVAKSERKRVKDGINRIRKELAG